MELQYATLDIDTQHTARLVEHQVGIEAVSWMLATDRPTYEHQLGVGQLTRNMLALESYPDDFCDHVAPRTALHDIGKFRSDVLDLIRRPEKLSDSERDFVRKTHSDEGGLLLRGMELPLASFVAHNHHKPLPENYMQTENATAYGITHLTKICDAMHALAFDRHRPYVAKREGKRPTPADVGEMLLQDYAKNPPIILGHALDVERAIRTQLQL